MKKTLLVLMAVAFVSSLCFFQQRTAVADEVKVFTGKVVNVTPLLGRPPTWTYNRIKVTDDKGAQETFFIKRATTITDVDGKNLTGNGVKKDKKVEIKYSIITNGSMITNGKNGAISVRYLD